MVAPELRDWMQQPGQFDRVDYLVKGVDALSIETRRGAFFRQLRFQIPLDASAHR